MPPVGLESSPKTPGKTSLSLRGGAHSGALKAETAKSSSSPSPGSAPLEALAVALLGLAPEDRAKLIAMLIQNSGEKGKT